MFFCECLVITHCFCDALSNSKGILPVKVMLW